MAQRDEKKLNGAGLGVLWTRITQLLGMKTFGGVPLSTGHRYSVCSTAAGTAAKTVTLTGFSLVVGAEVTVRFTSTNKAAAADLTLNVNSTGAKGIRYRNAALPGAAVLETGRTYTFVYDGTYWQMEGDLNTDTTYQKITQSEIIAGTDTNGKLISADVLKAVLEENRIKMCGHFTGNTTYAKNSLVQLNGHAYLSNKVTTNAPCGLLRDGAGNRITFKESNGNVGYYVIDPNTTDDWDMIL